MEMTDFCDLFNGQEQAAAQDEQGCADDGVMDIFESVYEKYRLACELMPDNA